MDIQRQATQCITIGLFKPRCTSARIQTLKQLQQSGGVVILDAISMFHPMLNQSITRSGIGSYKRTAILVISPIDTSNFEISQMIEQVVDSQMEPAYIRFDADFDHLCEIGVGGLRGLKRWLFATLYRTNIGIRELEPNLATLKRFEQQRGEKSSGYGPADFPRLGGGQ